MFSTIAAAMLPFAVMVSVYFFLRGHNLPGGGFIAGLVTAIAILLQAVASGQRPHRSRFAREADSEDRLWTLVRLLGLALLVATLTGLGSWAFGYPFLTSTFGHPVLPVLGELPLATAALFDLGVYLAVVGATVLALAGIGRLSRGD
jgi:multicomponent K+:H+ antiporter subunit A